MVHLGESNLMSRTEVIQDKLIIQNENLVNEYDKLDISIALEKVFFKLRA